MSCTDRTFSADFKAGLVIELLEGKKDAATIAEEKFHPLRASLKLEGYLP